jgi:hypothetical protein
LLNIKIKRCIGISDQRRIVIVDFYDFFPEAFNSEEGSKNVDWYHEWLPA